MPLAQLLKPLKDQLLPTELGLSGISFQSIFL